MRSSLLALLASTSLLTAQNCPNASLGTALGVGDDTLFAISPIGFAFPFGGTTYTDVHVCTNGYLFLSNAGVPAPGPADYSATTVEFVTGSPRIAPMWTDLNILAANGGQVYVNSTAAQCTITWKNAQNFGIAAPAPLFDIQAQLYPSGEIRFYYTANAMNNSTLAAGQPCIVGTTPGLGAVLPAGSNLSAGGATTDNTTFELFPLSSFDLANNAVLFAAAYPGYAFATLGPAANCSAVSAYGTGCGNHVPDSFYELMPSAGFDLSGTTMTMVKQPSGYVVLNSIPGTFVTPSATAVVVAPTDDSVTTVALSAPMPVAGGTTSSLSICSNGRITLSAANNGTTYTPVVATLLNWPATEVCASWHDYNPTAGGDVLFEEIGGIAYVTWSAVFNFGTTIPDTFQVQFNLATGDITIVYQTISNAGASAYLVGYSVGGPSADFGPTDLSTALPNTISVYDIGVPLTLKTTGGGPVLGTSSFRLDVGNVPPIVPVAFVAFGDTVVDPGIDLTFLGMPGCNGYTNLNLGMFGTGLVAGGTGSLVLPIPGTPALAGTLLATQGIAFSLDTPLNLISSNGVRVTVGY